MFTNIRVVGWMAWAGQTHYFVVGWPAPRAWAGQPTTLVLRYIWANISMVLGNRINVDILVKVLIF